MPGLMTALTSPPGRRASALLCNAARNHPYYLFLVASSVEPSRDQPDNHRSDGWRTGKEDVHSAEVNRKIPLSYRAMPANFDIARLKRISTSLFQRSDKHPHLLIRADGDTQIIINARQRNMDKVPPFSRRAAKISGAFLFGWVTNGSLSATATQQPGACSASAPSGRGWC